MPASPRPATRFVSAPAGSTASSPSPVTYRPTNNGAGRAAKRLIKIKQKMNARCLAYCEISGLVSYFRQKNDDHVLVIVNDRRGKLGKTWLEIPVGSIGGKGYASGPILRGWITDARIPVRARARCRERFAFGSTRDVLTNVLLTPCLNRCFFSGGY